MVLALFSQEISESVNDVVQSFLSSKFSKESKFYVEKKLHDKLAFDGDLELISFNKSKDLDSSIDLLVSIGGDGTFLRTIEYVRDLKGKSKHENTRKNQQFLNRPRNNSNNSRRPPKRTHNLEIPELVRKFRKQARNLRKVRGEV